MELFLIKSMVPALGEERPKGTWLSLSSSCDMHPPPCLVLLDPLLSYGLERHSCFMAELCKKSFQRNVHFSTEPFFIFACILIVVCLTPWVALRVGNDVRELACFCLLVSPVITCPLEHRLCTCKVSTHCSFSFVMRPGSFDPELW